MSIGLVQRSARRIEELDRFVHVVFGFQYLIPLCRDLLDALHKRGFRTNQGIHSSGHKFLVWSEAGGYYLGIYKLERLLALTNPSFPDVGASQLIADGKIKLKNDSQIKEFIETGLLFEDDTELLADVVVFATGYVLSSHFPVMF